MKFHYHVHKSPPLDPIFIQLSLAQAISSYISKSHFSTSSHLYLDLPSGLFIFSDQNLYVQLVSREFYMPRLFHPP
jgi:hypothetical protein